MKSEWRRWRLQAEKANGDVEDMFALAVGISHRFNAHPAEQGAAKRVANSARNVLKQEQPSGLLIEVLRLRFAALLNTLNQAPDV